MRSSGVPHTLDAPHIAGASVELHLITGLEPAGQAIDGDHCGKSELARDNRGMREEAPALHQQSTGRRKQHYPPRIRTLGHENLACLEGRFARIAHDPCDAAYGARITSRSASRVAVGLRTIRWSVHALHVRRTYGRDER